MHKINDKLAHVTARLRMAAKNAKRDPSEIQLIAASKGQTANQIREAYDLGLRAFGENYLQEARDKQTLLTDLTDIQWHFLGPIQSNKTRIIAQHFTWAHSIDRYKVAARISEQRDPALPPLQVCLQVNIDDEINKAGVSLNALEKLARDVVKLPNIQVRGLMAIPAKTDNKQTQVAAFQRLASALKHLNSLDLGVTLDTLSMGMSQDLEVAISEGATMIRVGTDIFGPRKAKTTPIEEST